MGLLQDWIRKRKEMKEEKESYERGQRIEERFHTKKLSSDERELNRFREEDRQKRIKQILERRRKIENDKMWRGKEGNPVYTKNVIANHQKLFSSGNMFAHTPDAVNQPDVVKGGKKLFYRK